MGMDRADANSYLIKRWPKLIASAGLDLDGSDTGFGAAIDDALLVMGFQYSKLATAVIDDSSVLNYRALLRFHALTAIEANLADPDHLSYSIKGDGGIEEAQSNLLKQCRGLLADARTELLQRGLSPDASRYGTFAFDFLEPVWDGGDDL